MAIDTDEVFINAGDELREGWPDFLPQPAALDRIWLGQTEIVVDEATNVVTFDTKVLFPVQLGFSLPGLDDISLVLGARNEATVVPFHAELRPEAVYRVEDVPLAVRLPASLLKPVRRAAVTEPGQPAVWEVDPTREFPDINLADVTFEIDGDGNIDFSVTGRVDLPEVMLGESGVVLSARDIAFHFDPTNPPVGQDPGFRGIFLREATLSLPGELGALVGELEIEDAFIGNGGFTGSFSDTFTTPKQVQFFGSDLELRQVSVSLVQNAFTGASMRGLLTLPFFDEPLEVEISFTLNGDFSVRLADESGIIVLEKDGVFRLAVNSLGFEVEGGRFRTIVSGELTPTIQQDILDWPTIEVRELSIDQNGNVQLGGGWLNLPKALALDFFGFQLEITKLGLGQKDDGGKWIAMNGALRLVDGMQAGASVEGLRVTWYSDGRAPSLSFEGIGVELEIANAMRFKGFVAFKQLEVDGERVHRFEGDVELELLALNLTIDAELVFGHANSADGSYNFMGIFLGVELPAGIPLFTTGLGLYGMAGLFASQLAPDKAPDEAWYGVGPNDGWYKRPELGVTDLTGKWTNKRDALGLGLGVTLGTLADNGYAFSGRLLLLLLFPGPVLMIEGRANLLKERSKLTDEPLLRTLAILDFNAGTFLFGIDAQYRYDNGGRLVELAGSAEAYFNLDNPGDWHFWLGQREPREKRIRARLFQLFEANAYFMLDARSLAMGAWFGYSKSWKFSKLRVSAELWSEGHVGVSWRPPQFTGGMRWHGGVRLSAFGVGIGFSVEVGVEATVFDPFSITGDFRVELSLPWPLPDLGATVRLRWGPDAVWPKLPLPLAEAAIEHVKVTTTWPLPRAQGLLAPNYDSGDGLRDTVPGTPPQPPSIDANPPPANAPVVPMDSRPRLTFSRQMHDDALVGVNARVPPTFERIGNTAEDKGPIKVKYSLREVRLDRFDRPTSAWIPIARKAADDLDPNPAGVDTLYGSWAPIPDFTATDGSGDAGGHAQVKLWLWSANPFDYTRRVGRAWEEWFTDNYPGYPCPVPDSPHPKCYDFETVPLGTPLDNGRASIDPYIPSYRHPDNPAVEIIVDDAVLGGVPEVTAFAAPIGGRARGVSFAPLSAPVPNAPPPAAPIINSLLYELFGQTPVPAGFKALLILMPTPNVGAYVIISPQATVIGYDTAGTSYSAAPAPRSSEVAEILARDLRVVVAYWNTNVSLGAVCELRGPSLEQIEHIGLVAQHNVDSIEHFEERGFVFDGHTDYRVRVVTEIDARGERELSGQTRKTTQTEYAFFKTDGPPKLADLSIPIGQEGREQLQLRNALGELVRNDGTPVGAGAPVLASELNDLGIYVRQTLPVTIPAPGQPPDLPRPVYRAYDLGVEFNENYVQLMYRLEGRDLALYLFDQNDAPVRDSAGRLIVLRSNWEVLPAASADPAESVWITTLRLSTCAGSVNVELERDEKLALSGMTLEPDTIYDARLNPLLLHEDFGDAELYPLGASASGTGTLLGRFVVEDQGGGTGTSTWTIAERGTPTLRFVSQTSDYSAGDPANPEKPGTLLFLGDRPDLPVDHRDQPSLFTDYRISALLRAADDDAIGLVFRRETASRYYRFSMDRERRYRRLTLHVDGAVTVLAEDDFTYQLNTDYEITIEALADAIRVYQDGERVFQVTESSIPRGTIGLYAWSLQGASFADIRVDDLRLTSRSAFVYRFTTSRFANFEHQVHSYQDETWTHAADTTALALLAPAVPLGQPATAAEHRAWDAFQASESVDELLRARAEEVQVIRLVEGGDTRALLLRSPEPLDVTRTRLSVFRADARDLERSAPGFLKLTSVTRHPSEPNQESVSLILRDTTDPSGAVIEQRRLPPLLSLSGGGASLLDERFSEPPTDPDSVEPFAVVDEGSVNTPSAWRIRSGALEQRSNVSDGQPDPALAEKLGTLAIAGSGEWTDYRVRVEVRSDDSDALGVVFRYVDPDNYYRLSLDAARSYRRLIKRVEGTVTVLWEDGGGFGPGADFSLTIDAVGSHITAHQDGAQLFSISDDALSAGRIGLYAWENDAVRFSRVQVTLPNVEATTLFRDDFAAGSLAGWTAVDKGTLEAPSSWTVVGGQLHQDSNLHSDPPSGSAPEKEGTYLVTGDDSWTDVVLRIRLETADDDAIGAMFRVIDDDNYYRFSMDRERSYRRLVKKEAGAFQVLWEDGVAYDQGRRYELVILAVGARLEGYLDGSLVFSVEDGAHERGRVALYCWGNQDSIFSSVRVYPAAVFNDRATIADDFNVLRDAYYEFEDEGETGGPSAFNATAGKLLQTSAIRGADTIARPGVNAMVSRFEAEDFRASVIARTSSADAGMGLVFRSSPAGYYRFALDRGTGLAYLLEKTGTSSSVLFSAPFPLQLDRDYALTVECVGSAITGYVNGVRLFALHDESHARGKVGLYAANNPTAVFDRLRVALTDWFPYYRFGGEDTLPAGTRVRIFSGGPSAPFAANPLELVRHAAAEFERGENTLDPEFAELRIVEAGIPMHQREFRADGAYVPVGARVLRRADGTGYALVPDGGSAFVRGDYRIELEYRRGEPGTVLSERGQTTPELVHIDVPWQASNED